jgi:hypothetical protein
LRFQSQPIAKNRLGSKWEGNLIQLESKKLAHFKASGNIFDSYKTLPNRNAVSNLPHFVVAGLLYKKFGHKMFI